MLYDIRFFLYAVSIMLYCSQCVVGIAPQPYYTHGAYTPIAAHGAAIVEPQYIDPNPSYSFRYGVNDPHTGDQKSQEESLHDGVVEGKYSLAEADGTYRVVTYSADKVNGFNAVVEKHGAAAHSAVHAVPAPIHVAAPVHHVQHAAASPYTYSAYH